jgi:hypothetical protein
MSALIVVGFAHKAKFPVVQSHHRVSRQFAQVMSRILGGTAGSFGLAGRALLRAARYTSKVPISR